MAAPRALAKRRFLLLIDQVMAGKGKSERDAGSYVGVDPTLPNKTRKEARRGFGPDGWALVEAKIGLRPEWFTDENVDESDYRAYLGPAPETYTVPAKVIEYARHTGQPLDEAFAELVDVAEFLRKRGRTTKVEELDDAAPAPTHRRKPSAR